MNVRYDPDFIKKLKKVDVRVHRAFEKKLTVFLKNPFDLQLNNHELRDPYKGLRSIDITSDYRAVYEEIEEDGEDVAYFTILGTHKELFHLSN